MSLRLGAATSDAILMDNPASWSMPEASTYLFWVYFTALTALTRFWWFEGVDGAAYTSNGAVDFFDSTQLISEHVRASSTATATTSDAALTTGKWWCIAQTESEADGPRIFVGDLATRMRECAYSDRTPGVGAIKSGTVNALGIGNVSPGYANALTGRIAFAGRWRRRMTIGELWQQQFAPHPDADCDQFLLPGLLQSNTPAFAVDASSESDTGTAGSASVGSFQWTHGGAASGVKGVLVFTFVNANADNATAVTYGGVSMTAVASGRAVDTLGEPGDCKAWFLSSDVLPQGSQTVVVTRTNNANVMYAVALSFVGAYPMEVVNTPTLQTTDGTLAVVAQNTGSRPAIRVAAINSGLADVGAAAANVLAVGAGTTLAQSIDFGVRVAAVAYETTKGSGNRSMGWSAATSDDRAAVYLAIAEKIRDPNLAPLAAGRHGIVRGGTIAPNVPIALPFGVADSVVHGT